MAAGTSIADMMGALEDEAAGTGVAETGVSPTRKRKRVVTAKEEADDASRVGLPTTSSMGPWVRDEVAVKKKGADVAALPSMMMAAAAAAVAPRLADEWQPRPHVDPPPAAVAVKQEPGSAAEPPAAVAVNSRRSDEGSAAPEPPTKRQRQPESETKAPGDQQERKTSSRFVGVSWQTATGKWVARVGGQYVGCFDNEESAARTCDVAARRLRGMHAHGGESGTHQRWRLNFPTAAEGEAKAERAAVAAARAAAAVAARAANATAKSDAEAAEKADAAAAREVADREMVDRIISAMGDIATPVRRLAELLYAQALGALAAEISAQRAHAAKFRRGVFVAAVVIASRQRGQPRQIREVATVARIKTKLASECYKLVAAALGINTEDLQTRAPDLVRQICRRASIVDKQFVEAAKYCAVIVQLEEIGEGKAPTSLACASIYLVGKLCDATARGIGASLDELAGAASCTCITRAYAELYESRAAIVPALVARFPWIRVSATLHPPQACWRRYGRAQDAP